MNSIQLGKYRHYKGGEYEVVGTAILESTLEQMVLYRPLYTSAEFSPETTFVRPLAVFLELVEVDGRTIPRFQFVEK